MAKKTSKKPIKKAKLKAKPRTELRSGSGVMPLGSRVLIRPFTKEELAEKNNFGFIMPLSDSKEKGEQGKVLAVGPGEWKEGKLVPVSVKVGDKVAFSKYGYEDISVNGEELFLIKEENILAILN
jgi:chaperonin GroES